MDHFYGGARNQNHNRLGIGSDNLPDQFALAEGQMQVGAVQPSSSKLREWFKTRNDNRHVGFPGGSDGAFDQVGTAPAAVTHRVVMFMLVPARCKMPSSGVISCMV